MERPSKILIIGSGAVKIAEAAEFDYSGNQALKAVKEEGIETVLVNPNIATIQTSYKFADKVYLLPLTPEHVAKIIEEERPDGIMIGFGGQTALSLGVRLHDDGVLSRYSVKVYGTSIEGVRRALSRELFRRTMEEKNIPVPPSLSASSMEEALEAAEKTGYPVMVRVSFNLGGAGSFVAWNEEQLREGLRSAFAQSEIGEVLIERYLHHWKEIEFEVVRDYQDNVAAVACMENLDPMGVHTGESIVVAPCQTLTDHEYQLSRDLSIAVERAIELVGEGNVQVAVNPYNGDEMYVIETNPRMSRSSALASKATGYPLAYVAAKLALGYKLYEVTNKVTGVTRASFEPSLDYVVVKAPRWDLEKFDGVVRSIGTEMKSVGEVMAVGRSFIEALQKAMRMLDIGEPGVVGGRYYEQDEALELVLDRLRRREPYWPLHAAKAFRLGATVEEVYRLTGIDKYFLEQIRQLVLFYERLKSKDLVEEAKRLGLGDEQIARALGKEADEVREFRRKAIRPVVKQIDTLAAEWPAVTNYLYLTYNGWESDVSFHPTRPKVIVLGAGGFRIGVSVEFDWSIVTFAEEAKKMGYEVIVVNNNPETVSTDWDMVDRLYFDEVSAESVEEIYELEKPVGVVAFLGGQISNNIASELERRGVRLLGTPGKSIDMAENRSSFSKLLEELGIKQPPWTSATSLRDALDFAQRVGYPVLVRPSYVLSGTSMKIARSDKELLQYLSAAANVSPKHPVVVSKFIEGGVELDLDVVSDGQTSVGVLAEHLEPAGVHSGDSTMVLPHRKGKGMEEKAARIASSLVESLKIVGPFNLQLILKDGELYVIELNLRASRSMPLVSKATGFNMIKAAAQAVLKGRIEDVSIEEGAFNLLVPKWYTVKSPQFSWSRLRGAYPHLGPEMRSVGEVAAMHETFHGALLLSWLSVAGNRMPRAGERVLVYDPYGRERAALGMAASKLSEGGYEVITIEGMEVEGARRLSERDVLAELSAGRVGAVMTTDYAPELDYKVRRLAADLSVPLVLNSGLAAELAESFVRKVAGEIKDMRGFWELGYEVRSYNII
ncbi:MAG: carbamoyl-phosphate synthase (glutamine-hydrolyzing) large subunit [Acidilobaceae archaeon]|nr:carbamoyl-phosphate synthase (glutamine-hydrolyzing) large subunit [Acidilobaceae archaeon]MCX8165897.1 carbamoyl-phosphate synthase (glutamine-hydrolyzing) large subunit [Acidilobaceae archaeon]MDW7974539.1 carbamoyl-phosphate synthase (glutamine-hydrolyzing) large subunit [Sulfolobales archaeon]